MSFAVLIRGGSSSSRYGRYLAELCRSEGLTGYEVIELGRPAEPLAARIAELSVVVVARGPLYRAEAEALREFAENGGGVVLIRPSRLLAQTFGFAPVDLHLSPAYVAIDPDHPVAAGFDPHPLQTHVPVDLVGPEPPGAAVATVWSDPSTSTGQRAVTELTVGDGKVVVFHYDVARAVARLRQGDPERAGSRAMGVLPQRQMDLLVDEVDRRCWHLPQADVQMRLLANAITVVARNPLPRWWYYPDPEMVTVVVQDSDDDWSSKEDFDTIVAAADEFGFHDTFYLMLGGRPTVLTDDDVAELRARGHSFGIHHDALGVWAEGEDQELVIEDVVRADVAEFERRFGYRPLVNRNHCGVWQGYAELARVLSDVGVRMELNAVGMGDVWLNYLYGSSRPVRYVDLDGAVLKIFQQPTQVMDDLTLVERLSSEPEAEAKAVAEHLHGLTSAGHGPLSMISHPVSFAGYSAPFFRQVWEATRSLGLPIWSTEEWARYTLARDACRIEAGDGPGTWTVTAVGTTGRQTLMIPVPTGGVATQLRVDGAAVSGRPAGIHGVQYVQVPLSASEEGTTHTVTLEPAVASRR